MALPRTSSSRGAGWWQEDAGIRDPQGAVRTRYGVKKRLRLPPSSPKEFPIKTVAEVIGVSRSSRTHARATEETDWLAGAARRYPRGRDQGGHRRAANLRLPTCPRHPQAPALAAGVKPPDHKRLYRVMKVHGLLLDRHVWSGDMTDAPPSRATAAGVPMALRRGRPAPAHRCKSIEQWNGQSLRP
jgi:hypothetical protein